MQFESSQLIALSFGTNGEGDSSAASNILL